MGERVGVCEGVGRWKSEVYEGVGRWKGMYVKVRDGGRVFEGIRCGEVIEWNV